MKRGFSAALIILAIYSVFAAKDWDKIVRSLTKNYQKVFLVWQYNYYRPSASEFIIKSSFSHKLFCNKLYYTEEIRYFLEHIAELIPEPFYQRNHTAVSKIELGGEEYIVKYGYLEGAFDNLFSLNRGVIIWSTTHWIKELGLPTVTPIALIEERKWNRTETYCIYKMRKRDGMRAIEHEGKKVLEAMYSLIYKMPSNAVMHADLTPQNLVENEEGEFEYIDLDGCHRYPLLSYLYQCRFKIELERFRLQKERAIVRHALFVTHEKKARSPERCSHKQKKHHEKARTV